MNTVVLGLGSNIGDKRKNLNSAVHAISLLPNTVIKKASAIYQTKPVGFDDQDDFYNAVIIIETDLSHLAVLGACLGIEASMGRVRLHKKTVRESSILMCLYTKAIFRTALSLLFPIRESRRALLLWCPCLSFIRREELRVCFSSLI